MILAHKIIGQFRMEINLRTKFILQVLF